MILHMIFLNGSDLLDCNMVGVFKCPVQVRQKLNQHCFYSTLLTNHCHMLGCHNYVVAYNLNRLGVHYRP